MFLVKAEDLDLLDHPEISVHKVSKVTSVTEVLLVR